MTDGTEKRAAGWRLRLVLPKDHPANDKGKDRVLMNIAGPNRKEEVDVALIAGIIASSRIVIDNGW